MGKLRFVIVGTQYLKGKQIQRPDPVGPSFPSQFMAVKEAKYLTLPIQFALKKAFFRAGQADCFGKWGPFQHLETGPQIFYIKPVRDGYLIILFKIGNVSTDHLLSSIFRLIRGFLEHTSKGLSISEP